MSEIRPTIPGGPQQPRPAAPQPMGPGKIAVVPIQTPKPVDSEPIKLVDEPAVGAAPQPSKIRSFSSSGPMAGAAAHTWKRQPHTTGEGAVRVRSFHGRLSDEGMEFLDNKINEWMDNHTEVEVKFVTTNIGVFEGKIREPALIINVWY